VKNCCTLTLKCLPITRLCERADAVKALAERRMSVQEVLDKLAADKEHNADKITQAG